MRRALLAATLVALAVCSAAAAHGGGGALGVRSSVTKITPSTPGLSVAVVDYDDRLQLRNDSSKELVVLGYEGEPYLAFRNGRVERNMHSPATYLNDDRYGDVELPAAADPKAAPDWEQVSDREVYEWHDHRIHWMSKTLPPKVAAAKDEAQHVFDWTVPARLAGERLTIAGTLDYVPPPGQSFPKIFIVPIVLLVLGGAAAILVRRRRLGPAAGRRESARPR
jgi:hypothetical protein